MKRLLTILLTTLALTVALCVSASASSFDAPAEDLAAIGMLKGSADGFNLDQAPTRNQAAIMLVRLFGAEDRAQKTYASGRISCPFTDATETTAPYLAWLVDEGLASGTSDTTFGGSSPCTAKAYTIFLLRALGYKDNEDFTAASAQEFAAKLGIQDTSALSGSFLRDDLVALTYQALAADMKDGKTYLLDNLIKNEAVDPNVAGSIVGKIENYRAINSASQSHTKGIDAQLNMEIGVTVSDTGKGQVPNQINEMKMSGSGTIKMILNKNPQMAFDFSMTVDGEKQESKMWLKDGVMYMESGDQKLKTEMPQEAMDTMISASSQNSGYLMLPFAESLDKKESNGETTYTLKLSKAFDQFLNQIMAQVFPAMGIPAEAVGGINISGFTATYTIKAGTLTACNVDMAFNTTMDTNLGEGTPAPATIGAVANVGLKISASGNAVKISFPDFSKFNPIIGGADAPAA